MKGWVITRVAKDGSKRDDACWRTDAKKIKTQTFRRRKDADRHLTNSVKRVQDGTYREIQPITFKQYAEKWLKGLGDLKPSTQASYASMLSHQLIPAFGDRPLTALGVEDINAWLGAREGTLRPKTLRNYLTLLHKLFGDAQEEGYLAVNRLAGSRAIRRPRALREDDEHEIEILTPAEVHRLLDALAPEHGPLFLTAVSTGVRLGELRGLQWGDVDDAGGRVWVRRTIYRGQCYLPKSKRSRRAIDVGEQLLAVFSRWRREHHGDAPPAPDAFVFPSASGGPLDPDNLRNRVWAPALAAAKLRHVRIHSLRHTYASMLIAQGENVKYISSQLGHASVKITLDRYGHLFPDEKRSSAARLEQQLASARPSSNHPAERAEAPEISTNSVETTAGPSAY
jgi:integrase